jgi:hypothetical protein
MLYNIGRRYPSDITFFFVTTLTQDKLGRLSPENLSSLVLVRGRIHNT